MRARLTKLSEDSPMRTPFFEGEVITAPMIGERCTLTGHALNANENGRYVSTSPVVGMVVEPNGTITFRTESDRAYRFEELPDAAPVGELDD